jgi:CheY-like chemotaxis protein
MRLIVGTRVVLSVEDNDITFYLLGKAFAEIYPPLQLRRVSDGEEAMAFLERAGPYSDAPRPDLVLLNLDLPKKSGREVLAAMQASDSLRSIPVVVFTSSALDKDRAQCLALGAQDFITKPSSYEGLITAVKSACARAGG